MGLDVNKVAQDLGISVEQARKLDGLDGNNKDGVSVSIYDMAKLALAKDQESKNFYREGLEKDGANLDLLPMVEQILLGKVQATEPEKPLSPEQGLPQGEPNQFYGEQVQIEMKRPPKAADFDYSKFPKKNRFDASELVTGSINAVMEDYSDLKKINPYVNFVPDYEHFPDPKDYRDTKQYGGKEKTYIAWENAVKDWVRKEKKVIADAESVSVKDLVGTLSAQMNSGFFNLYMMNGITQQEISDVYYSLNGDIGRVKQELDARISREGANTRAEVRNEGTRTRRTVIADGNLTRFQEAENDQKILDEVEYQGVKTRQNILDEVEYQGVKTRQNILDEVEYQGVKTRQNIENNKQEEEQKAILRKEIAIAWQNNPEKLQRKLRRYLVEHDYRFDRNHKDLDNNAVQTIIENMSLQELQELRNHLITPASDPLVH